VSARLDHVVVVVAELATARRAFAEAGFTVVPGGRHDELPTENALVCLADGTYLELLAMRDRSLRDELRALRASARWDAHLRGVSAIARRFLPLLAGDAGVADWVLLDRSLAARAAELRRHGVVASGPVRMSRARPDGETVEWELLLPESRLQPFRIADRTPPERRVPGDRASTTHANGARGIAWLRVRTRGAGLAALALGDTLGLVPAVRGSASVLDAGGWRVEVLEGAPEGAFEVGLAGFEERPGAVASLGIRGAHAP